MQQGQEGVQTSGVPGDLAEPQTLAAGAKINRQATLLLRKRLANWLREKLGLVSMEQHRAMTQVFMMMRKSQRAEIDGLRRDHEALTKALQEASQAIADARGETQRVEHYLNVYRQGGNLPGHYELMPIPRNLRRSRGSRRRAS